MLPQLYSQEATAEAAGTAGLVIEPEAGDGDKFLKGDGTWADVTPTVTADNVGLATPLDVDGNGINETTVQEAIAALKAALTVAQAPVLSATVEETFLLGSQKTVVFTGANFSPNHTLNLPEGYSATKVWNSSNQMTFTITPPSEAAGPDTITLSNHSSPDTDNPKTIIFETIDLGLGSEFEGGIVFYLDQEEGYGLVAAKHDMKKFNGVLVEFDFDNCPNSNFGGSDAIGAGVNNTPYLINNCGSDATSVPNNFNWYNNPSTDYNNESDFDDWYLPSIEELRLLYVQLYGTDYELTRQEYHYHISSSQHNNNQMKTVHAYYAGSSSISPHQSDYSPASYMKYYARPVRTFTF